VPFKKPLLLQACFEGRRRLGFVETFHSLEALLDIFIEFCLMIPVVGEGRIDLAQREIDPPCAAS
jgi:hypothetical protein